MEHSKTSTLDTGGLENLEVELSQHTGDYGVGGREKCAELHSSGPQTLQLEAESDQAVAVAGLLERSANFGESRLATEFLEATAIPSADSYGDNGKQNQDGGAEENFNCANSSLSVELTGA
jgi:hypothetical protein